MTSFGLETPTPERTDSNPVHLGLANYAEQSLQALCSQDLVIAPVLQLGEEHIRRLGNDDYVIDVGGFRVTNRRAEVDCRGCLEWMHS